VVNPKNVWYLSTIKKYISDPSRPCLKAYWYCGGYGFSEIIEGFQI
jgi:hypothetical protein